MADDRLINNGNVYDLPYVGPMPDSDYRNLGEVCIGGSEYSSILRSPAHWANRSFGEPSEAMKMGTAIHCAVLEPDDFDDRYMVEPAIYKREGYKPEKGADGWTLPATGETFATKGAADKAARPWAFEGGEGYRTRADAKAAIEYDAAGRDILTASAAEQVRDATAAVMDHAVAGPIIKGATCELAVLWRERGILCRGKADALAGDILIDLKTVYRDGATPAKAPGWIARSHYHTQLAHYAAGVEAIGGTVREAWIVMVEAFPPFAVAIYKLTPRALEIGKAWRGLAFDAIENGRDARGNWRAYPEQPIAVDVPAWAAPPDLERAAFDDWIAAGKGTP